MSSQATNGEAAAEALMFKHPAAYKGKHQGLLGLYGAKVQWSDPKNPKRKIKISHSGILRFTCDLSPPKVSIIVRSKGDEKAFTFEFTHAENKTRHAERWKQELERILKARRALEAAQEAEKRRKEADKARREEEERQVRREKENREELERDPDHFRRKEFVRREGERRAQLLVSDEMLRKLRNEFVVEKKVMTEQEFWETRDQSLYEDEQCEGVRGDEIKLFASSSSNNNKNNSSSSISVLGLGLDKASHRSVSTATMVRIFAEQPHVQKAYDANVPLRMPEGRFWDLYYRAEEYNRKRRRKQPGMMAAGDGGGAVDFNYLGSSEAAFFSTYKKAPQGRAAGAAPWEKSAAAKGRRKHAGLDPRADLRSSELYEGYTEEEFPVLLQRRELRRHAQDETRAEKRRKLLVRYNRASQLLVDTPEIKERAVAGTRNEGVDEVERSVRLQQDASRKLGIEHELGDLKKARAMRSRPLKLDASFHPRVGEGRAAEAKRAAALHLQKGSREREAEAGCRAFAEVARDSANVLRGNKYVIRRDVVADAASAEAMMEEITSAANEAVANSKSAHEGGANDQKLIIYKSETMVRDVEVDGNFATELRKFSNRVHEIIKFYWSNFPPKNSQQFQKLTKTKECLAGFQDQIEKIRKDLYENKRQPETAEMLNPLKESLSAIFVSHEQIEVRLKNMMNVD